MFQDFLKKNEVIFYENIEDLNYKINKYKKDDKNRRLIAKNGKIAYFKNFNSTKVANYIIEKTYQINSRNSYIWEK